MANYYRLLPTMANYAKVYAVGEEYRRRHIPDDIADEDIVEAETELRRLRIKTENRRLNVEP